MKSYKGLVKGSIIASALISLCFVLGSDYQSIGDVADLCVWGVVGVFMIALAI